MVFFNYSTMQMAAKVVYYGPGLCGKTTNLQWIFEHTSTDSRGEMVSLATETDRTLFFDLLPIDVGSIAGFSTRIQLYTVPGQVFYNTTRKLVLKGVDGVVFVADSQQPMLQANIESFQNLEENLAEMGLSLDNVPLVLQYNKRDLPNICSVEELDQALNRQQWPGVEASAINGMGVFETLKTISKKTLVALKKRLTKGRPEGGAVSPAPRAPAVRPPPRLVESPSAPPAAVVTPVITAPPIEAPAIEVPPIEELPVEELPVEELPVEEPPVEELPIEELPVEELPVEELPELEVVSEVEAPSAEAVETPMAEVLPEASPPEEAPVIEAPPAAEEPATEEPATEEPATEEPATEEPATEEPAAGEPVAVSEPVAPAAEPLAAAMRQISEPPAAPDRPRSRKRRAAGFDALAELEKLRRETVRPRSAAASRVVNGRGEIHRDFHLKLKRSDFNRAHRFSLTLQLEDEDRQVVDEARHLHVEIDDAGSLERLLLHLNIDLSAKI